MLLLAGFDKGCFTTRPTDADDEGSFLLGDSSPTSPTSTITASFDNPSFLTGESILILFGDLSATSLPSLFELSPLDSLFFALFSSFARTVSNATG